MSTQTETTRERTMYTVMQSNADTGETFTGTGDTLEAAIRATVAQGQASTQYRADDAAWVAVLAAALQHAGTADRGFARYSVTESTRATVSTLAQGQAGIVAATGHKFNGRAFTVVSHGTQGRLVMVEWSDNGKRGSILANTPVESA